MELCNLFYFFLWSYYGFMISVMVLTCSLGLIQIIFYLILINFFRFHPSICVVWKLGFVNVCSHDLRCRFNRLAQVNSIHFFIFFYNWMIFFFSILPFTIFFKYLTFLYIYPSILGCLRIKFCNFFQFALCKVILVLWI